MRKNLNASKRYYRLQKFGIFYDYKKLIKRQVCQAEFLLEFDFIIFYILGKKNQKADLLTYCPNNL